MAIVIGGLICNAIKLSAFQHPGVRRASVNRHELNGSAIRMAGDRVAQHLDLALVKA